MKTKWAKYNLLLLAILIILTVGLTLSVSEGKKLVPRDTRQTIGAFMRLKNEIKTLPANLDSIDGLFDKYVIIHSPEPDDGSVAYAKAWCATRRNCHVVEYPHRVYPSLSKEYFEGQVDPENSMAAYSTFGINQFSPEEWIINIDADQVYIRSALSDLVRRIRTETSKNDNAFYCLKGYNTFVWHNRLVKLKYQPIMGTYCDHYATKRKNLLPYERVNDQTVIRIAKRTRQILTYPMYWFHFKKTAKYSKHVFDIQTIAADKITYLTNDEVSQYVSEIAPLFPPDHPYSLYHISLFETDLPDDTKN